MTVPVSTVDTVKDYLLAQITAQIADTSVLVCYDQPGTYQPDDIVMVGDIAGESMILHAFVGSGGAGWLQELYSIAVEISVTRANDDASGTWKRAKALSDAVDIVVRTDPSLGGVVQIAWPSKASYVSEVATAGEGRRVTVSKKISVEAIV